MKPTVPADVPKSRHETFIENYTTITRQTNKLFLFACDQKMEHLNEDFTGTSISAEAQDPEHMFRIGIEGSIGALAAHIGLISRYANSYPGINYVAKLNGKTPLTPDDRISPISAPLHTVEDALDLISEGVQIRAVGVTVYPGSTREDEMLSFAAHVAHEAHLHGLVTILWAYPRGPRIEDNQDPSIAAGVAGLGNALGYDFVKIKPPHATAAKSSAEHLATASAAAGNTGVICSGMSLQEPDAFLKELHAQLQTGHTSGSATGRNIFQRSLKDAVAMTHAIAALVYDNAHAEDAINIIKTKRP